MSYDLTQIADEIDDTAEGVKYYGNALYIARDLPFLTYKDRLDLTTALDGNVFPHHLKSIATKIRNHNGAQHDDSNTRGADADAGKL